MISRRAFLTALAALPLVGRWMPKQEAVPLDPYAPHYPHMTSGAWYPTPAPDFKLMAELPATITDIRSTGDRLFVTCGDRGYEVFQDGTYIEI